MASKDIRNGGETHQRAEGDAPTLTADHGVTVSDSLRSGARGPTLLEEFVLRGKIFHKAGAVPDAAVTGLYSAFVKAAGQRFCDREPSLRTLA